MPKLSLNASKKTKHTPAGEIPVDWGWAELKTLSSIRSGGTPSKDNSSYWDGHIPWLSAKDLKWSRVSTSIDKLTDQAVKDGARLVPTGSILVLVRGMTLLKRFPVALTSVPVTFNQDLKAIVPDEKKVTGPYLAYFLDISGDNIRASATIAGHGTGRLALEVLTELPVPLPPLPEQRRIAEVLGTWDRAIETLESLIAAKERRKQALMQQLLTGRKRLPGFKGKLRQAKLSELLVPHLRPTPKPSAAFLSAGIRSHGRGVFLKQDFEPADIMLDELFEIQTGDLIVNITFAWEGAIAIVPPEADGALVSHRFPTFRFNQDLSCAEFFRHVIRTHDFVFACGLASPGGAGRNRVLSKKSFLKITIPCPSLGEQQAIAAVLDTADRELTLHRQHLATLRTQKRGLMGKLLTGEVRVKP